MNHILKEVNYLVENAGSLDVEKLAESAGAYILDSENLTSDTDGFTLKSDGQINITVKKGLAESYREFVICHELGHAILHTGFSTFSYRALAADNVITRNEAEANIFALNLLLKKVELTPEFNSLDFVHSYGLPDRMAEYLSVKL